MSNVHVRRAGTSVHDDKAFLPHVRGEQAIKALLGPAYQGLVHNSPLSRLVPDAVAAGIVTPAQACEVANVRCHCGRRDYRHERRPDGRYVRVFVRCRCCVDAGGARLSGAH